MRNQLLLLASILSFSACDIIEEPDNGEVIPPPTGGNVRRVLLEDFTGFTCPNCPAATEVALALDQTYGEDLIVIGVHCTSAFAAPIAAPPAPFSTDFRTVAGEVYWPAFGITALPKGLVSRREFNGSQLLGSDDWASAVAAVLQETAQFEVLFANLDYDDVSGAVDVDLKVPVLSDVTGNHFLVVCLVEDHVIEGQIDNRVIPPEVYPYDHRHVLRDNLNGTWGQQVIAGSASIGDTLSISLNYALSPNVLEAANCSLVAYIYREDNDEVMQVNERKLIP